jgi:hypothetical protein
MIRISDRKGSATLTLLCARRGGFDAHGAELQLLKPVVADTSAVPPVPNVPDALVLLPFT